MSEFQSFPKPSHNRRVKKRGDRSEFSKMVRAAVKEHFDNTCQICGYKGIHIHHVQPKGSGIGRGVFTNALLLCNKCHRKVHDDDNILRHWKEVYRKKYGPLYFMDADDLKMKYLTQELRQEDKEVREWTKHNGKFKY
jgi:5-methylcytosine-specific restriction endonuclease McrA